MWIIRFQIFFINLFLTLIRRRNLFFLFGLFGLLLCTWLFLKVIQLIFILRYYFIFEFLSHDVEAFRILHTLFSLSIHATHLFIYNLKCF